MKTINCVCIPNKVLDTCINLYVYLAVAQAVAKKEGKI